MAQEPTKLLLWSNTRQPQGNSEGLACPCFLPEISRNRLSPHLFSPCLMFRGSDEEHCCLQNGEGLLDGLLLVMQRDSLTTLLRVETES